MKVLLNNSAATLGSWIVNVLAGGHAIHNVSFQRKGHAAHGLLVDAPKPLKLPSGSPVGKKRKRDAVDARSDPDVFILQVQSKAFFFFLPLRELPGALAIVC